MNSAEFDHDEQVRQLLDRADETDKIIRRMAYFVLRMMVAGSVLFFLALFIWMWVTGEVAPI